MSRILLSYATMAGSTVEVAQALGEELSRQGFEIELLPIHEVKNLQVYDAIVLGAPMIMGWHREALAFLRRNQRILQNKPVAIFVLAMSLTKTEETMVDGLPVFLDENLPKAPKNPVRLSFRERYTQLSNYLHPILAALRPAKPASIAVFGGRMEYGRLKWWAVLFAMLIIKAPAGDKRNWEAIRTWAAGLPKALKVQPSESHELLGDY